jgi:hypothetical protein
MCGDKTNAQPRLFRKKTEALKSLEISAYDIYFKRSMQFNASTKILSLFGETMAV